MASSKFPSEWLDELKSKNDILSTISSYIPVIKKGSQYWARCPFHHEKTPSFAINENGQFYHCFGCGESGDVITFVEKMESITTGEAIRKLAERAGLEMPMLEDGEKVKLRKKEKDDCIKALNLAKQHYIENLYKSTAKSAQEYVKLRKFKKSDLDKFEIGYSNGNEICEYLKANNVSKEIMIKAGIIGEVDGRVYDHISNRLVFPIINSYGDCIGFSGRLLEKSDIKAKYKNTAQTIVFDKGSSVYGIHLLKEAKKEGKLDQIILVEGQIDVIMMHSFGFSTAVASLGTAFTEKHASELKRFSNNLTLIFDGDQAGEKATLRAIEILKPFNFNLKVARLPEGSDPDEYLKQYGVDEMKKLIISAKNSIEYRLDLLREKNNLNKAEEKANYIKKALELVDSLSTMSEKDVYLKIISEVSKVPLDILRRDVTSAGKYEGAKEEKRVLFNAEDVNIKAIKFVLLSILKEEPFAKLDFDLKQYLFNPFFKNILGAYEAQKSIPKMLEMLNDNEIAFVKELLETQMIENGREYFNQCVWRIVESDLKMRQQILNEEYKQSESTEERTEIAKELAKIIKKLNEKKI